MPLTVTSLRKAKALLYPQDDDLSIHLIHGGLLKMAANGDGEGVIYLTLDASDSGDPHHATAVTLNISPSEAVQLAVALLHHYRVQGYLITAAHKITRPDLYKVPHAV